MLETIIFCVVMALVIYIVARKVIQYRNDPVRALISIGRTFEKKGNNREALKHYQIAERECKRGKGSKGNYAKAVFLQGRIYKYYQNFDKAMPLLYKAEQLCRELNDKESLAHACMCIAEALEDQEKYKEADEYYTTAVELWRTLRMKDQFVYALFRQGRVKANYKKYKEAIELFEKAGRIWKRQFNTENVSQIFIETAECKAKMRDKEGAIADYTEAEKLLKKLGAGDGVNEMQKRIKKLQKS